MIVLTKAQRKALYKIWLRDSPTNPPTYKEFRKRVVMPLGCSNSMEIDGKKTILSCTLMLPWAGMWLGIEPDGYTHS